LIFRKLPTKQTPHSYCLQANGTEEERFNLTTLARLVADGSLDDPGEAYASDVAAAVVNALARKKDIKAAAAAVCPAMSAAAADAADAAAGTDSTAAAAGGDVGPSSSAVLSATAGKEGNQQQQQSDGVLSWPQLLAQARPGQLKKPSQRPDRVAESKCLATGQAVNQLDILGHLPGLPVNHR
jgi:hypothetical protein